MRSSPLNEAIRQLVDDRRESAAGPLGNTERVVSLLYNVQRGPVGQAAAHGGDQVQLGKLISSSLKEEHRHFNTVEVIGSAGVRSARSVKREAKEG
jgi:hypothetical protein